MPNTTATKNLLNLTKSIMAQKSYNVDMPERIHAVVKDDPGCRNAFLHVLSPAPDIELVGTEDDPDFLQKCDDVLIAIRRDNNGKITLTNKIATIAIADFRNKRYEHLYELGRQEVAVLRSIADVFGKGQVADPLCLAEQTVENHAANSFTTFRLNSRNATVTEVTKKRLVSSSNFPP